MTARLALHPRTWAPLLLAASVCACTLDTGPEATFEAAWTDFDELYGGFEIRGIDWDDVYTRYRPLVDDDMSDDELFELLATMLAETNDGHVHITAPGRVHWSANAIRRELIGFDRFDIELVRDAYLEPDYVADAQLGYTLGTLEGGYTYVNFEWVHDQLPILADVRTRAEASGGLVLDLRHNLGGDFTWALDALADWTSSSRMVFRSRTRNGPGRQDFTPWFDWSIEGRGTDIDFPVVVLIDRYTISAGERMVMALAAFDQVRFVGEPTSGAISTAIARELPNGWYITVATQEVFGPDGSTPEGVGFEPDELVVNDLAQMQQGIDATLDRAVMLLDESP